MTMVEQTGGEGYFIKETYTCSGSGLSNRSPDVGNKGQADQRIKGDKVKRGSINEIAKIL